MTKQFYDIERDGVTQGSLGTFMSCPEKAKLAILEGLTLKRTSGALAFGSLVHDVLEEVYSILGIKGTPEDFSTLVRQSLERKEAEDRENPGLDLGELEENYGKAQAVLEAYFVHWVEEFQDKDWKHLEHEFNVVIEVEGLKIPIRGKMDGVFVMGERLYLLETKTKSQINEDAIMDKLNFDFQVMLYLWALWKETKEIPAGVLYNIIRKPQLRQKKTENLFEFIERIKSDIEERKDHYFVRYLSHITKRDLVRFDETLRNVLSQYVRWYRGEFHYKNSYACQSGGIVCQFLSICSRNDKTSFIQKERPFTELGESE